MLIDSFSNDEGIAHILKYTTLEYLYVRYSCDHHFCYYRNSKGAVISISSKKIRSQASDGSAGKSYYASLITLSSVPRTHVKHLQSQQSYIREERWRQESHLEAWGPANLEYAAHYYLDSALTRRLKEPL